MTKEGMIYHLHRVNRVQSITNVEKMTKRIIAERMNCYITPSGSISRGAFFEALGQMVFWKDVI